MKANVTSPMMQYRMIIARLLPLVLDEDTAVGVDDSVGAVCTPPLELRAVRVANRYVFVGR
jgi:hypothetical protein